MFSVTFWPNCSKLIKSGQDDPMVVTTTLTSILARRIMKQQSSKEQKGMAQETLQQLGLSPNEAKIYEALLELKEARVGEISSKTNIHGRNVYDSMQRLCDKGLVFPVLSGSETLYSPVDPDKLMELIREKELMLQNALRELRMRYEKKENIQEAYIYKGLAGIKRYMRDILREGEDVYCIGAKLGWFNPKLEAFRKEFYKEAERKKIKFYHIFDAGAKEYAKGFKEIKPPYKFLPPKYSTNSAIDIFGDYVVTFAGLGIKKLDKNTTIFVMKDKHLAETYKAWFRFMFDNC